MRSSLIRRFAGLAAFGGLLLLIPLSSLQAMTVSPVRLELSGDPGTTAGGSFKVINDEAEAKTLYTVFENFEASGETGSPSFKGGNEGLASWLSAPKSITIAPGETKTVDFAITIPQDAEAGGYFAAIFLGTVPPSSEVNQLSIGARIGTLVLFRVNGDIKEGAALLEFASKDQASWYNALPINFYYRFQNTGTDRIFPKGALTVRNMFGRTVRTIDANPIQGNILPKSVRRFELWWQAKDKNEAAPLAKPENLGFFETASYQWNNFAFGRYTVSLDLQYGSRPETAASSLAVFVFPWQLITIEVLGLIILALLLRFVISRYNRWVVSRARS